jgi:hypothetical protein
MAAGRKQRDWNGTGRSLTTAFTLRTTDAGHASIVLICLMVFVGGCFSLVAVESRQRVANELRGVPAVPPAGMPAHKIRHGT